MRDRRSIFPIAVRPFLPARILGRAGWRLQLMPEGLQFDEVLFSWKEISDVQVSRFYLWTDLRFRAKGRSVRLKGIERKLATALRDFIPTFAQLSVTQKLLDYYSTRAKYLARYEVAQALANLPEAQALKSLAATKLLRAYVQSFKLPLDLAGGDYSAIDARNQAFVIAERRRFQTFFDKIESQPLTEEQRDAAIVMEDNNLVVAAAGSGKTSTLVAKFAYVIERGYCEPAEILILAFNKEVAEEIRQRISNRLGIDATRTPRIQTFHAFGLQLLARAGQPAHVPAWVESGSERIIDELISHLAETDPQFAVQAALITTLSVNDEAHDLDALEESEGTSDYAILARRLESERASVNHHVTLSRDTVRSYQELHICNWLTLHGIKFQYERHYDGPGSNEWFNYRPDFYYPGINCWHEHFGINKFGKAPDHFNRLGQKTYEEMVDEKRVFLNRAGVSWFETRSGDFDERSWDRKLSDELTARGLKPKFIGWGAFIAMLEKSRENQLRSLASLIAIAIKHYKNNNLDEAALRAKAQTFRNPHFDRFLDVFLKVLETYEAKLRQDNALDYEDMLIRASALLETTSARHSYKLIMVDEFQDMNGARTRLIQSLKQQDPSIRLFGVGDDWQSIYRFTGADITAMTKFEDRFGATRKVVLSHTFRANQGITDVASEFIQRNPEQLTKPVIASNRERAGVIRTVIYAGKPEEALVKQLADIASLHGNEKPTTATKGLRIAVLGRYNFLKPKSFPRFPGLHIEFSTVHRAKGREWDIVIVLAMTDRRGSDFPATKMDPLELNLFLPTGDQLPFGEERRLFYVALTRAKHRVILMVPQNEASRFVIELQKTAHAGVVVIQGSSPAGSNSESPTDTTLEPLYCPQCKVGRLQRRVGRYGPFLACDSCKFTRSSQSAAGSQSPSRQHSPNRYHTQSAPLPPWE